MRKGRTSSKAMSRYKAYKARKHRTKARVVFNHVEVTKATEINLVSKENKNTRVAFNSMDIDNSMKKQFHGKTIDEAIYSATEPLKSTLIRMKADLIP